MKPKSKKPGEEQEVPATTKALQAWKSELRRLETRLGEWANQLAERERVLEEQEKALEEAIENAPDAAVMRYADKFPDEPGGPDLDDDCYCDEGTCNLHPDQDYGECGSGDCGCGPTDAGSGCDCPKCQNTRADWVGGPGFSKAFKPIRFDWKMGLPPAKHNPPKHEPAGDEVKWLENLWKLEDKRKKK